MATNLLLLVLVSPVMADGESTSSGGFRTETRTQCETDYGGKTTCKEITEKVEIPEEKKTEVLEPDTGIAEIAMIVTALFGGGMGFLVLAQKQLA